MKTKFWIFFIMVTMALLMPQTALADGIIIPKPPPCDPCPPPPCPGPYPCPIPSPMMQLVIRYHRVDVSIKDQVAVTQVDQFFYNPNEWEVEGTYIFPLPEDAAVTSFTLWVDGEPVEGKILEAEQARQKYQEIVSNLRDPALLEYAGRDAVQAHIYPIPPGTERQIQLEYSQVLSAENGLVGYTYPLSTEKYSLWPLKQVSIHVDIQSHIPIRTTYSPTHSISTNRESDNRITVGYEASNVLPDTDFTLYYSLGEEEALHLLSFRDPNDPSNPDGFFLLLLAPRPSTPDDAIPKDIILVLDRSGSMEGEKFRQAQEALFYILEHLNSNDRFNVITFSTGLEHFDPEMIAAEEKSEAIDWLSRQTAAGSTDINRALLEAASMADKERPTYLIFLTDGLPTEGVVDSQQILNNLEVSVSRNLRIFSFGVGYDVDTYLLDSISKNHHGASSYVLPDEPLNEHLSTFYEKISTPVLTNLELDFGKITHYDLYPNPLPDLFSGSQIVLLGRYKQGGETTITLTGQINGETQSFKFPETTFVRQSDNQFPQSTIPRIWATRKIGHLLNQIRLKGPDQETIDQIVYLSIRYGIITPYTSYLVDEAPPLGSEAQERIAGEEFDRMNAMPTAPVFGQAAVEKAAAEGSLSEAEAPIEYEETIYDQVKTIGSRTFVFDGEKWIDTTFDPEKMVTKKIDFLSEEYFSMITEDPVLANAFSLGQIVIALSNGIAYEVSPVNSTPPSSINTQVVPTPEPTRTSNAASQDLLATQQIVPTTSSPANTPLPTSNIPISSEICSGNLLLLALLSLGWLYLHKFR
jgi:Ca-activated chloride channel family protein